jgi:hypothetical protein
MAEIKLHKPQVYKRTMKEQSKRTKRVLATAATDATMTA